MAELEGANTGAEQAPEGQYQQAEKTFTQADVDRIVGERLSREGVQDAKEVLETLKAFGYEGTPAEVKATLKVQAEAYKQQQAEQEKQAEIDAAKAEAQQSGTSPELIAEIKSLKAELADIKAERQAKKAEEEKNAKAEEAKKAADEEAKKSFDEAAQIYGAETLEKLSKDEDFLDYVAGKVNTPVKTLVERFMKIKGKALDEAYAKAASKAARSTGSAAGSAGSGGTYGLTEHQQQLAKDNGMSLKEYAAGLSLVKK